MATLKDVADLCGVSMKTVSNVVNNYAHVSSRMRHKVMQAIEQTGYVPDETARRMAMSKTNDDRYQPLRLQFGCVLRPDISKYQNPFFLEVFRGVEGEINDRGYLLSFIESSEPLLNDPLLFNYLCSPEKLHGIVSFNYRQNFVDKITPICPLVTVGVNDLGHDWVDIDFESGARQAFAYLTGLGHRKIGFVGVYLDLLPDKFHRCYRAYRKMIDEFGLEYNPRWMVNSGRFFVESGYQAMRRMLKRRDRPTAIYCICDELAYGVLKAIREAGLRVPEDISVIGSDDLTMSELVMTPLTTIRFDRDRMGRAAVRMLLERRENPSLPQRQELIPGNLVVRESCRPI